MFDRGFSLRELLHRVEDDAEQNCRTRDHVDDEIAVKNPFWRRDPGGVWHKHMHRYDRCYRNDAQRYRQENSFRAEEQNAQGREARILEVEAQTRAKAAADEIKQCVSKENKHEWRCCRTKTVEQRERYKNRRGG